MVDPAEGESVDQIIGLFRELMGKVTPTINPGWMEEGQLTLPQLKTAMVLGHDGECSVGTVAQRLKIGEPTASHLIDRLVQAGLAERNEDPSDRRRTLVRLSSAGRRLVEERLQRSEERLRVLLRSISPDERDAFKRGMGAIVRVARTGA